MLSIEVASCGLSYSVCACAYARAGVHVYVQLVSSVVCACWSAVYLGFVVMATVEGIAEPYGHSPSIWIVFIAPPWQSTGLC